MATEGEPLADWQRPELRAALARRDISEVYRLLRRWGVSQRRIAACTGQSQSEVHDIVRGRAVRAYDVLARIADGLGIPREYLGLAPVPAYRGDRDGDAPNRDGHPGGDLEAGDESVKRRRFLANAAAAVLGEAALGSVTPVATVPPAAERVPHRIGLSDVARVEAITAELRGVDKRYGGGACRAMAVAHLSRAEALLPLPAADSVRDRLHRAMADLHCLAGWTAHDAGLLDHPRHHLLWAIEHAKVSGSRHDLVNALYRMGLVYLDRGAPDEALKLLQLAEVGVADTRSGLASAAVTSAQAWAYAALGRADRAVALIERAEERYAENREEANPPGWLRTFQADGPAGVHGQVYAMVSVEQPRYLNRALDTVRRAFNAKSPDTSRGRAVDLARLATLHLRAGDTEHGIRLGHSAVTAAQHFSSAKVRDRLRPLAAAAARVGGADGRDLARAVHRAVG
jgi:tetratricopeptide (TPR) repeat protein